MPRLAVSMDAAEDNHFARQCRVDYDVWKSMSAGTTELAMNNLIVQRIVADPLKSGVDRANELGRCCLALALYQSAISSRARALTRRGQVIAIATGSRP